MLNLTPKPGVELLIVEVPATATDFELPEQDYGNVLQYCTKYWRSETLPPGLWSFIATTDTLTEEQAKAFVLPQFDGYSDYRSWEGNYPNFFTNPLNSFRSLVQSAGGDTGKCWAILLKQ